MAYFCTVFGIHLLGNFYRPTSTDFSDNKKSPLNKPIKNRTLLRVSKSVLLVWHSCNILGKPSQIYTFLFNIFFRSASPGTSHTLLFYITRRCTYIYMFKVLILPLTIHSIGNYIYWFLCTVLMRGSPCLFFVRMLVMICSRRWQVYPNEEEQDYSSKRYRNVYLDCW